MTIQFLNSVLAIILSLMMFGLGLAVSMDDFRALKRIPKSVVPALIAQVFILPLLAVFIVFAFDLKGQIAFGFVLLAATPGGVTAAIFSQFCSGRIALNVTLTAINTAVAFLTVPLAVTAAAYVYLPASGVTNVELTTRLLQTMGLLLGPVAIGMAIKANIPSLAARLLPIMKTVSILGLSLLVVVAFYSEREKILTYLWILLPAICCLAALSLLLGYGIGHVFDLSAAEKRSTTFELGIHNSGLSIYITSQLIGGWEAAVPSASYTIVSYLFSGFCVFIFLKSESFNRMRLAS
jgi:bile acid:Na+ symporter, BASS family